MARQIERLRTYFIASANACQLNRLNLWAEKIHHNATKQFYDTFVQWWIIAILRRGFGGAICQRIEAGT